MNNLKLVLLSAVITLSLFSCKKETGPAGPAGTNGNANVKAFLFSNPITNNWYWTGNLAGVTDLDSSLLLAYAMDANCDGVWYSVPGVGCFANYTTRMSSYSIGSSSTIDFQLLNPDGSFTPHVSYTITKLRIIVAPAGSVISGKKELDFNDYHEVCRYYGIKE